MGKTQAMTAFVVVVALVALAGIYSAFDKTICRSAKMLTTIEVISGSSPVLYNENTVGYDECLSP